MDFWDTINLFQIERIEKWHNHTPNSEESGLLGLIEQNHLQNFLLWHEEDKARNPVASDQEIAQVKRNIDALNQKRNDLIEQIDEAILEWMKNESIKMPEDAPSNSETPGNIIDRSSIMALKIVHMKEQTTRSDVGQEHVEATAGKLRVLQLQRKDLLDCLSRLISDIKSGCRKFKVYRQFKMYNDPSLNPKIYKTKNQ